MSSDDQSEIERLRRDNALLAAIIDRNKRAHRLELARLRQSLRGVDAYVLDQRAHVEAYNRQIAMERADETAFGEKFRVDIRREVEDLLRSPSTRKYLQPSRTLLKRIIRHFNLPGR